MTSHHDIDGRRAGDSGSILRDFDFAQMSKVDIVAGLCVIAIGVFALVEALNYPFGSTRNMGPGYFPTVLSVAMIAIGIGIILVEARAPSEGEESAGGFDLTTLRSLITNMAGFTAFALLIERAGLLVAAAVAVFLASRASPATSLLRSLVLSVAVAGMCGLVFVYGLHLQMRLLP
ncbi:tripartite tricarboxylate transporter TctB family protein [Acuticoccus sediminis]|uniref:tripartite tricarboxylate transporter TctB family protein n=1 Tax=Acuticoccus sediminis TaxID=2184697 RepID=UPI00139164BF|nr:tripartite tricarboxylate transporter TctB family protein [Acuticoccus sediminis]